MTETQPRSSKVGGLPPDAERDLRALHSATARDLPSLEHSIHAARSRRETAEPRKEPWMSLVQMKRNPWLVTATAVAVVVVALLVIPVSYEKTSSHDVTLTLEGLGDPEQVKAIASEFKTSLGSEAVKVTAEMESGSPVFKLEASVPGRSGEARAKAFGQALLDRGYVAAWTATPKSERVWGSVYAYARDRVIQVDIEGKSAQQLQDEIRQRFVEAGITNTQVSVTDLSGGGREVKVKAEHHTQDGQPHEPIELQLTKDGKPIVGQGGQSVQVRRMKNGSGQESMVLDIDAGGRSTKIEIPNPESKSDAELTAEVNAKLMQAGINDYAVEISGMEITLRKR